MRKSLYLVLIILMISCKNKVTYEKPENLIPKDQMIDLLYDMHLANGTSGIKNKDAKKDKNYMSLVYEKYKIDSTQFAISNTYYVANINEYEDILEEVEHRLKTVQEFYQSREDSITESKIDSNVVRTAIKNRNKFKK